MSKSMSKSVSKPVSNNTLLNNLLKIYLESKDKLNPNQNAELEVKFATRGIKRITKINFDNVIKQLLSNNFKFAGESNHYLRITSDNIRCEIIGLKNIQEYCRTNSLPSEIPHEGYSFLEKKPYTMEENTIRPVNFDDFNFRVSYNIETSLSPDSQKINTLLSSWSSHKKFYRLLNRYTLIHDELPVLIDFSIIRESNKDSRNKTDDIKDSNIFNLNEKYEIEIEIKNDIDKSLENLESIELKTNLLDRILKKVIKYVLCGLQETNYPISYDEQHTVQNNYLKLVKKERYNPTQNITTSDFIGPSSVTLQILNISPINPETKVVNIRDNYTVTDKADGDRKLLYISSVGKIYLITTNMNIQFTGAETKNKDLYNSLIDGEHIIHNKFGRFINLYAAFDIYYIGGNDVREFEFFPLQLDAVQTKFRLPILTNLITNLDPVLINTKNIAPIRIEKKVFYESNEN